MFRRGGASRTGSASTGRTGMFRRDPGAIRRSRAARDTRRAGRLRDRQAGIRHAPHNRAARRRLRASAARYGTRRAFGAIAAGLVGALFGIFGGRPGRRLHQRLTASARAARDRRDTAIRDQRDNAAAQAEQTTAITPATQENRAPRNNGATAPQTTSTTGDTMSDTGFIFDQAASDMEAAAANYQPEGAMHILATLESFPAALASIAATVRILAERCDGTEFPLSSVVGDALTEVQTVLQAAVTAGEQVGEVFRAEHADDIARHTDPRPAEHMWDTTNN